MIVAGRCACLIVAFVFLTATPTMPAGEPALPQAYVRLAPGPRYLSTISTVFANHDTIVEREIDDLDTGRSVTYDTDPLGTSANGFDGVHSWTTDDTGLALIDDTPDGMKSAIVYARLSGRPGPEQIGVTALRPIGGEERLRLRYPGLSGPIDITMMKNSREIASVDDFTGGTHGLSTFSDYRAVGNVMLPFRSGLSSDHGSTRTIVQHATAVSSVPRGIFDPPPIPHDTELTGVTTVPLVIRNASSIVIPVRINGGPVLHVAFDSGSTNYLSPRTARRLGLTLVGMAKSGGVGAGLVDEQYTRVNSLSIGSARVRGIPFSVLDDGSKTDGTIGCEILERFAVQFDFQHRVIRLSRNPFALRDRGMPLPILTGDCQPEVASTLDGLSGTSSIDTGSGVAADIMGPFVVRHHLFSRYHATEEYSGGGIGGKTYELLGRGNVFGIGPFRIRNLDIMLSEMKKGAFSDPTMMANLGIPLLSRFTLTLDYRSHRMWLEPRRSLRRVPFGLN